MHRASHHHYTTGAQLVLTATVPDTVCVNVPTTLTAQVTGGTGIISYNWGSLGTGNPITVSFSVSQNVQVSVSDQNGCTSAPVILPVHVLDLNTATFTTYGDTTICPGGGVATVGATLGNYAGATYHHGVDGTRYLGSGPFTVPFSRRPGPARGGDRPVRQHAHRSGRAACANTTGDRSARCTCGGMRTPHR